MEIDEYLKYRKDLLNDSKDEEGFVQQSLVLSQVIPSLLEAKLIDSEDWSESYFAFNSENLKVNGYSVNESGERLQLFLVDENTIDINAEEEKLYISTKVHYDNQFKRVTKFLNKAIKGHLNDEIQDADPIRPLISKVSSSDGADQFDVMEVFLLSATATVETRGEFPRPKRIDFEDETINISFTKNKEKIKKEILIIKKLIDLNFLHTVLISQGSREALKIDFRSTFNFRIEAIKAASEENFESYLCVLPASILADLYKRYSSRLLEKNVRSFLEFRGYNKGIRETIRVCPEKFIAFNNGITITSTVIDLEIENGKTYIIALEDFQIVNGGQTTASIYFTKKDGFSIDKVKVMAKINVVKDISEEKLNDFINDIGLYSNSQTKVSKVDFSSRNPQIDKLKALSDSVMTPSGKKWFFEKSKGEFNTKLRMAGNNKLRIIKEYPKNLRFTKEQLGKYYTAWGAQPYIVKKGGEKVFRYFIEELNKIDIDRVFYENLISKIILFGELEKIYGQGKNSMGQIRSAVIPYSLSVIYIYTDGAKKGKQFNLSKIWKLEKLENDLVDFFRGLMTLMNILIKDYSESDDIAYYSLNPNLWTKISVSSEIIDFMSTNKSIDILEKYSISNIIHSKSKDKSQEVDFEDIVRNIDIHSKGIELYNSIRSLKKNELTKSAENNLDKIIASIIKFEDMNKKVLDFENDLMHNLRRDSPEIFDKVDECQNYLLENTLKFIILNYNQAIERNINLEDYFNSIDKKSALAGNTNSSIYSKIGKDLHRGIAPSTADVKKACCYFEGSKKSNTLEKVNSTDSASINLDILRQMVEWDSRMKILTKGEISYLADLAYELKPLNSFHKTIAQKHLITLSKAGFKIRESFE